MNKLHHICNLSQTIIFRNSDDYCNAINRLAACAHSTQSEIWAFAIMSTHFHIVVRTENLQRFMRLYQSGIAKWHNHKYKADIHLSLSSRELKNEFDILTAVNYVLKNPVHHKVVELPFLYAFSSLNCYYPEVLGGNNYSKDKILKPSELSVRLYRYLFARHAVPDSLEIWDERIVLPRSFIAASRVRFLYKSPRNFIFNITKPLKEELEMFDSSEQISKESQCRISLLGKKSDLELCEQLDGVIAPKTYVQLSDADKSALWQEFRRQGVDWAQFARAV